MEQMTQYPVLHAIKARLLAYQRYVDLFYLRSDNFMPPWLSGNN
jgi:hypothetical protein